MRPTPATRSTASWTRQLCCLFGTLKWVTNWRRLLSSRTACTSCPVLESGVLYALDLVTGARLRLWNLGAGNSIGPPTIGYDGNLYVQYSTGSSSQGTTVFAVDINTLRPKWRVYERGNSRSSFPYGIVSSEKLKMLYFPGGSEDKTLFGVNSSSGKLIYAKDLPGDRYRGCSMWAPSIYNDRLFYCNGATSYYETERLALIGEADPLTGQSLWHHELNPQTTSSACLTRFVPVISNGVAIAVVFTGTKASLLALNVSSISNDSQPEVYPEV